MLESLKTWFETALSGPHPIGTLGFYPLAGLILTAAVWTVASRNLFRSALALAIVLVGVALIFLYLDSEFLAVVQIVVYVGAILTLILFAIMLTARIWDPTVRQTNEQAFPALIVCLAIGALLGLTFQRQPWWTHPAAVEATAHAPLDHAYPTAELGKLLVSRYVLPFEIVSVVLLAALVGAIVISRRRAPG